MVVHGWKRIQKTRITTHLVKEIQMAEVDIYHGALQELRIVEGVFNSEGDSHKFVSPPWIGKEVTEDNRYKNKSLAVYGAPV